ATQRERRFASLRLVGATSSQVVVLAIIEALVGVVLGVGSGITLFFLLRPYAANVSVAGGTFFPQDFTIPFPYILGISLAVLLATIGSALIALRRVQISPLGIVRRIRLSSPRIWRILPICFGFAALQLIYIYWGGVRGHVTMNTLIAGVVVSFLGVAAGIVIVGPWITVLGGRLLGRFAGSAAELMAGRHLESRPVDIFRSVSGVVLALFICTTFAASLEVLAQKGRRLSNLPLDTTVVFFPDEARVNLGMAQSLLAGRGFNAIVPIYTMRSKDVPGGWSSISGVARSQFPTLGLKGKIGTGNIVEVRFDSLLFGDANGSRTQNSFQTRSVKTSSLELGGLVVRSKDPAAATEELRTLAAQYIGSTAPVFSVRALTNPPMPPEIASLQQFGYAGTAISILIAGCNLAVSVLGSALDRRRSLGLLRLAGMPTDTLTKLVLFEGALPLLSVSLLSILSGFAVAFQLTRIVAWDQPRSMPVEFYVTVAVSLVFSLGILTMTVPLMRRLTESGAIRTE
ncbi:FtsX-like permease family protein, partial [bacterium]